MAIALQLVEAKACAQREAFAATMDVQKQELLTRERAAAQTEIENEKKRTALAEKERDLALQERDMYKNLYAAVTKGPGLGCKIKKIFTLGLSGCH